MNDSIQLLEQLRHKALRLLILVVAISIVITLFLFILISRDISTSSMFFFPILVGVGSGYLLGHLTGFFKANDKFKQLFKQELVEVPFRQAFTQVVYDGSTGIDEEVIKATGIMRTGNRYSSNDYVQGYYKEIRFERADVTIQNHVSTGKSSYTETYLRGRWLIFEFNKDFHFDLQIISNEFTHSQKNSSIFTNEEERRHRIELEDMEFNEMFRVLCQDDHEAYYLLTPQFMSLLKDLYHRMDGSFMLGFIDNRLHVAIHTGQDAMEPKIFDDIDLRAVQQEVQKEIRLITDLIDHLALDRELFKKEGE